MTPNCSETTQNVLCTRTLKYSQDTVTPTSGTNRGTQAALSSRWTGKTKTDTEGDNHGDTDTHHYGTAVDGDTSLALAARWLANYKVLWSTLGGARHLRGWKACKDDAPRHVASHRPDS